MINRYVILKETIKIKDLMLPIPQRPDLNLLPPEVRAAIEQEEVIVRQNEEELELEQQRNLLLQQVLENRAQALANRSVAPAG